MTRPIKKKKKPSKKPRRKKSGPVKALDPLSLVNLWLDHGIDFQQRRIYINGEIEEQKMTMYKRGLMKMVDINPNAPIDIFISSFGGSVYDGLGLYDLISACPCPVNTIAHSKVMSIAFIIFLAGKNRVALPSTTFMIHSVSSSGFDGKVYEQEIDVLEGKRLNVIMMDILAKRTKQPKKYWYRKIRTDDFNMDTTTAFQLGIITQKA